MEAELGIPVHGYFLMNNHYHLILHTPRGNLSEGIKRGMEEDRFEKFRETLALGGAEFVEAIRKRAGKIPREVEGKARLRPQFKWEEVVATLEAVRGEKAGVWMGRHGDPGKWLVAHLARKYCRMTLGEIGEALGGKDYVAVAMGIKRYENRIGEEPALSKERDRVIKKLNVKTCPQ